MGCASKGQVADLVEKERAAFGFGERPFAPGVRAGERAALVPKKLAFDELAGDSRHVDGDEGARPSWPLPVKRARDELLSAAALAGNQDRQSVARQTTHLVGEPAHGDGCARDARQGLSERTRRVSAVSGYDDQRRATDGHHGPGLTACLADACPTHVGTVAGAQVRDHDLAAEDTQRAVPRTDRLVAEDEVRRRRRTHDEHFAGQGNATCFGLVLRLDQPGGIREIRRNLESRGRRIRFAANRHGSSLHHSFCRPPGVKSCFERVPLDLPYGDPERLPQREVLLAHREDEQLLHLLRRSQVAW